MILPDFLIIGAAKAGTTALYEFCREHPDIFMSPIKEVNFFAYDDGAYDRPWLGHDVSDKFPVRTLEDYAALFAAGAGATARGEASPLYLESPTAARRIRDTLPGVRLVASLRDPAERAYSGWLMHLRMGRVRGEPPDRFPADAHWVRVGFYNRHLTPYLELFPRERIRILLFEDLRRDPAAVMRELYGFLGVDPGFTPEVGVRHNVGTAPRHQRLNALLLAPRLRRWLEPVLPHGLKEAAKRLRERNLERPPAMPAALRRSLVELYREDILRLQDRLDRDLSAWLETPEPADSP